MPGFTESNITLDFPDGNYFRFASCPGYTMLSGNYFKEMDACWFDKKQNLYWLIELKDFSLATLSTPGTVDQRSWDLVKKATDTLCMFLSSKHAYPYAHTNLNACLPSVPDGDSIFKLVTVIHCNSSQKPDVQLINNSFKTKFKPYADLFGIKYYSVVEHSVASNIIPHNIVR